jgi:hypothetical protein
MHQAAANFPMAADPDGDLAIVAFGAPARLMAFAQEGSTQFNLPSCGAADDVFVDAKQAASALCQLRRRPGRRVRAAWQGLPARSPRYRRPRARGHRSSGPRRIGSSWRCALRAASRPPSGCSARRYEPRRSSRGRRGLAGVARDDDERQQRTHTGRNTDSGRPSGARERFPPTSARCITPGQSWRCDAPFPGASTYCANGRVGLGTFRD